MKIKPFKTQAELCWQAGRGWAVAKKSASNCSAEAGCLEGWRLSPIIKDIGEVGVPGPVCWQVQRSVTLLWADTVFISSCCLQQDQTVTHSYKLWWYMAPIIPHLDIKTLTCEQNKGWPCTSSCTVSIKMTDGGTPAEVSKHNKQDIQFSVPFNQAEKFRYNGHQEVIKD